MDLPDLNFLNVFDSDWARLVALALIVFAFVARPLFQAIVDDRKNKRDSARWNKELQAKADLLLEKRTREDKSCDD